MLPLLLIPSWALVIDPFLSPPADVVKKGSTARAQEGITSGGDIIAILDSLVIQIGYNDKI